MDGFSIRPGGSGCGIIVACPTCGNEIGEEIDVKGLTLFHIGGAVNREQRGWCAQCGHPFYWSTSDKQIQVVIKGTRILKKPIPDNKVSPHQAG